MKTLFTTIVLSTLLIYCCAQQKPISENDLTVVNRSVSVKNDIIHLNENENDGVAWLNSQEFTQGIIELDIKGKDILQQSFVGMAFHGLNDSTYEVVYFRPFNFRSNDPVRKAHAVQYVALPKYDWPKLRSEHPNQYEQPINPAPEPNDWFHVRIEIKATQINVFVNNSSTPSLSIEALAHNGGKRIGYWVGNGSAGDWKNLKITPTK